MKKIILFFKNLFRKPKEFMPLIESGNIHYTDLGITLESAESCLALKPDGFDGNPDGYDRAIIGLTDGGQLVYSKEWMVRLLLEMDSTSAEEDGSEPMTEEDAWEFLEYNCFCAYVGDQTPIFVNTYETF
jgi:hypothetical protein